ncbi:OmpA family protein [Blattabacterium cuenoti]|uniref:OmpA family protein n=1 Tax=Blattabacterium cuenoti TaxID=1653831 RepID=UPI00163C84F6|nr:OmpA family protein [Blattabacterium cuenoti]
MKNVNFFIITLFVFFSFVFSQSSHSTKKKWSLKIRSHDINYYPVKSPFIIKSPFINFFHKKNNTINPFFSDIEIVHHLTKNIGLYFNSTLGMVDNNRWKIMNCFFVKLTHGINFHPLYQYKIDPYLRLGGGYHQFNYENSILKFNNSKFYKLNQKHFFLLDGGLGINFWIVSNVGINVQSNYNHVIAHLSKDYLNFWDHSMGFVFRFGNGNKNQEEKEKSDSDVLLKKEEKEKNIITDNSEEYEEKDNRKNCGEEEGIDKDRISDKKNLCPNQLGLKKFNLEKNIIFKPILFGSGQHALSSNSLSIINEIAEIMIKRIPHSKFYISGCTDFYGKYSFNKILSMKRAHSVFKALVSRGVNPYRMKMRGFIKCNKKNNDKGRRVEIIIRTTKKNKKTS